MRVNFFKISIIVFWLLMTAWLVRYEAFPEKFTDTIGGYSALLQRGPLILDSWMLIESKGLPIGYSHTWIDTNLEYDKAAYTVKNRTVLSFKLMGQTKWLGVNADAVLDDQYCLQRFSAVMVSSIYSTRIDGRRNNKGLFDVIMKTPAAEKHFQMEIPDDVVIYSSMSELAMKQLVPGESIRIKTIDPLSLTVAEVGIEAVRREIIEHDGENQETTLLNITYRGMSVNAWIDDEGRVLREETPFGWVMRASTFHEVLSRRRLKFEGADLLASMAVPVKGKIDNPRESKGLKVRLNGRLVDFDGLESHRQIVVEHQIDSVVMELAAQGKPEVIIAFGGQMPQQTKRVLASSTAIQSDNPQIIGQAKKITAGSKNCFAAALAINDWVYRNVVKKATVSLPSALDVFQRREGDCNEHTYLFVALARAAGLPARINVGIVYAEPEGYPAAFYYHAWPSVFVGQWVEMDPTYGTPLVDAAYIRFATGELNDQMKLLGVLGRLSVDILEQK